MAPPSNIFTDMAPPSYASVTGVQPISIGDENDQHTKGNLSYIPVYTFAQPYQVSFLQLIIIFFLDIFNGSLTFDLYFIYL